MGIAKLGGKITAGVCKAMGSALEKSNEYREFMAKRNTNVTATNMYHRHIDALSKREDLTETQLGSELKHYTERRNNMMYDGISSDKINVKERVLGAVNSLGRGMVKGAMGITTVVGAGVKTIANSKTVQGIKEDVSHAYSTMREKTNTGIASWKENATTGFGKFMSTIADKVNSAYGKGETMLSKVVTKVKEGSAEFKDTVSKSSSYQKLLNAKNNMDKDVTSDNNFNKAHKAETEKSEIEAGA